jgi:hypothetical protein
LNKETNGPHVVSAAFCDLFRAGDALRALERAGFSEGDIELVGVLDGHIPNLSAFCWNVGMPLEHASYYQACFEDGGALLVIRTRQINDSQFALSVLRQYGGILPPTIN